MKPPPSSDPSSSSSSPCASPSTRRRAAITALRWLGEGLLFTPILAYYTAARGFARSLPVVAVENCLYARLFAACLPSPPPFDGARGASYTPRDSRRRAFALGFAGTLVFLHSFLIASQVCLSTV